MHACSRAAKLRYLCEVILIIFHRRRVFFTAAFKFYMLISALNIFLLMFVENKMKCNNKKRLDAFFSRCLPVVKNVSGTLRGEKW